jgi:hypothetical protein
MTACQQKILAFCISLFILCVGNSNRVEVCYGYKEEGRNKEESSNEEEGSTEEESRSKEEGSTEEESSSKEEGSTEEESRSKEEGSTEEESRSKEEDYRQAALVTGLSGAVPRFPDNRVKKGPYCEVRAFFSAGCAACASAFAEKQLICSALRLLPVAVSQDIEETLKILATIYGDLDSHEDTAVIRAVIAIVKQADIPSLAH